MQIKKAGFFDSISVKDEILEIFSTFQQIELFFADSTSIFK
jgi:hypothetical protein